MLLSKATYKRASIKYLLSWNNPRKAFTSEGFEYLLGEIITTECYELNKKGSICESIPEVTKTAHVFIIHAHNNDLVITTADDE